MESTSKPEALDQLRARLKPGSLEIFLEESRALAAVLDARGRALGWNPAFGATCAELPGVVFLQNLLPESLRPDFEQTLRNVLEAGQPGRVRLEIGPAARRGVYDCVLVAQPDHEVLFIAEPAITEEQETAAKLNALRAELDETRMALDAKQKELKAVLAQTEEVAHTDSLTFLPNRRLVIADLQRQVMYSERYGTPLSISMIDLDDFKKVNDQYGHPAGDQVLRFVASELRDHIRQPDEIGRVGGDEFLLILPNTTEAAAAEMAARLCREIQAAPFIGGKNIINVTLCIGIAQFRAGTDDWHSLLERADQALYQAKEGGPSQWAILKT